MKLKTITRFATLALGILAVIMLATILSAEERDGGMIEPMIYLSYFILGAATLLVLAYSLINLTTKKPEELKKIFISLGLFVGIILISYIFADGTEVELKDGEILSSSASKWVSTGLTTFYILSFTALGLMFLSTFKRAKK